MPQMTINIPDNTLRFKLVRPGEIFLLRGNCYMKTTYVTSHITGECVSAVNLSYGTFEDIFPDEVVELVKGELTIGNQIY